MSFNPESYNIFLGLLNWAAVVGVLLGLILVLSFLASLGFKGAAGPSAVFQQIAAGFRETFQISPRRAFALSRLTQREAFRRKSLLVFVVFAVLFMFAGWFLSNTNADRPALQVKVYISFVLTTITWLTLPVILMLSCWGIPDDIQARSLHTVVTKPVRRIEVVLGRLFGYISVGTVVLSVMGVVGYIWVTRMVPENAKKHLVCRVPVYANLTFTDREGNLTKQGVNAGDIWDFRGFIDGATRMSAIYEFENVTPDHLLKDGRLKLESRFESFRTHVGDIKTKLLCMFILENPNREDVKPLELPAFEVSEFSHDITYINRKLTDYDAQDQEITRDLFADFVHDVDRVDNFFGREERVVRKNVLRVVVKCVDRGQLLGMARPDLFIRMPDRSFAAGFSKTIIGIWLMMVLVIVLGVTISCFTKGPIAALTTFSLIIVGQGFRDFIESFFIAGHRISGPVAAMIGLVKQTNPGAELDPGIGTTIVVAIDKGLLYVLWVVKHVIPDFRHFSQLSQYIPNGFDVGWNTALLPGIAVALGYSIPCLMIGYYSLKLRELESK